MTIKVEVEMLAFGDGAIRTVTFTEDDVKHALLSAELYGTPWTEEYATLETAYRFGQNDFQPQPLPSVSVGDVIRLNGQRFAVKGIGFEVIK